MKYAIVGSTALNSEKIKDWVFENLQSVDDLTHVVSGGAVGIDTFAVEFAKENGIEYTIFNANWDKYDKFAGFLRNKKIIANSDKTIAFWDGISPGTKDSINFSRKAKHDTKVFIYNNTKTKKLNLW